MVSQAQKRIGDVDGIAGGQLRDGPSQHQTRGSGKKDARSRRRTGRPLVLPLEGAGVLLVSLSYIGLPEINHLSGSVLAETESLIGHRMGQDFEKRPMPYTTRFSLGSRNVILSA